MAGLNPKFTDTFHVQTGNYGDFIRMVRQRVIQYCADRRKTGIVQPVLPPEKKDPELWFHIDLRTKNSFLTLAIRMDNLYLVGFKTQAGVWWEFNNESKLHLLGNKSEWLGFGGRYQDLVGQKGLETVTLGRAEMAMAVDVLAQHGTTVVDKGSRADPYAVPKAKLVKLVIMMCEGLRFSTVYGTVDKDFNSYVAGTITELDGKQVNKWDQISKAVLKWAVDPKAKFPELEKIGIKDKNDAARIVLLVKDETSK